MYLEILAPYLNNPSEEAIFESNKSKEEHETITFHFKMKMLCAKILKSLINKLNRPVHV